MKNEDLQHCKKSIFKVNYMVNAVNDNGSNMILQIAILANVSNR